MLKRSSRSSTVLLSLAVEAFIWQPPIDAEEKGDEEDDETKGDCGVAEGKEDESDEEGEVEEEELEEALGGRNWVKGDLFEDCACEAAEEGGRKWA